MKYSYNTLAWVVLHALAILLLLTSLLTGLRIAAVSRPEVLHVSALLPQGYLHGLHLLSGFGWIAITLMYWLYRIRLRMHAQPSTKPARSFAARYHRTVIRLGEWLIPIALLSGSLLYLTALTPALLADIHYLAALAMLLYVLLHGGGYFVHYGGAALQRISLTTFALRRDGLIIALALMIFTGLFWLTPHTAHHSLSINPIPLTTLIDIDGVADEPAWETAQPVSIHTYGGANFTDGQTWVTLRALHNGSEAFFHITWQDATQSLTHLPLVKTSHGWQVQENGFYTFDERTFYEDKFAVMLANNCDAGAAGTLHLGPQPLTDKPANWHGLGYHYAADGVVRDLWHWKAVRTNAMLLADDNFIGAPDVVRSGARRYTAGYLADGKESGAYVMNWQWYSPAGIVPKRLPKHPADLAPYQTSQNEEQDWVVHWYHYDLYDTQRDTYPTGTVMPSVLYTANRMEGDRADVRAQAVWANGHWSLELVRRLDTGSAYDVALQDGVCLWVSAFDHAQIAHTRHNLPIRLSLGAQP